MAKKLRLLWRDTKKMRALKIVAAAADLWKLAESDYSGVRHRASAIVSLMVIEAARLRADLEEWQAMHGDQARAHERGKAMARAKKALQTAFVMGSKPTRKEQVDIVRNADRVEVARDLLELEAQARVED